MIRRALTALLTLCALLLLSSCAMFSRPQPLVPLDKIALENLVPGLLPVYFENFKARNVAELPDDDTSRYPTRTGEPVYQLDNQFGIGEVFGSGMSRLIGVRMRGALYFPEAGNYSFQALSNDGIAFFVGDALVVNDPLQHGDQLSGTGSILIPEKGWYPVRVDYFQRKGTAALKLYWQPPGAAAMEIVPASAYAHLPSGS